ncbi:MAG: hypothetical protein ACI80V_001747 [Rhodothermales bacterium]|jgi:hypothetical protein
MKTEKLRSKARWFLSEIAVIVVGVLIAIWLNALYSDYSDRRQEQTYLNRLADDFDQTVLSFEQAVRLTTAYRDNVVEMLWLANKVPSPEIIDSLRVRFSTAFLMQPFEPVLGTYQELISEGKLELISDDSLRIALVGFEAGLRALESTWDEGWEQYNLVQVPFSIANMNVLSQYEGGYAGMTLPPPKNPENTDVYWTREFSNVLTVTAISRQDQIYIGTVMLIQAQNVRSRIERSLR